MQNNANPTIVVATYNRIRSLRRLLDSLEYASYDNPSVRIHISIDGSDRTDQVFKCVQKFLWTHGEKVISVNETNLGLREHILKCGDLVEKYGSIILLEDDLYVSKCFYNYACKALTYYQSDAQIAGIALYSHIHNESANCRFEAFQDGYDTFFMKTACSWGQCWSWKQWSEFRDWYSQNSSMDLRKLRGIPENVSEWSDSSWKKYFIAYMIATDKYFAYPRVSHTSNFQEIGVHHKYNDHRLQNSLMMGNKEYNFPKLSESYCRYDAYCEIESRSLQYFNSTLAVYEFDVDLHGSKPKWDCKCEWVLTSKATSKAFVSFERSLKPIELNVFEGLPGNDISLGKTDVIEEVGTSGDVKTKLNYYYGLPKNLMCELIKDYLQENQSSVVDLLQSKRWGHTQSINKETQLRKYLKFSQFTIDENCANCRELSAEVRALEDSFSMRLASVFRPGKHLLRIFGKKGNFHRSQILDSDRIERGKRHECPSCKILEQRKDKILNSKSWRWTRFLRDK